MYFEGAAQIRVTKRSKLRDFVVLQEEEDKEKKTCRGRIRTKNKREV
jgi:hypothetical protein